MWSTLVEVSRDKLKKTKLKIEPHSIAEVAAQAIEYASLGPKTHLVVNVPVDLEVSCNRDRLIQIVVNLLSNAARYGKGEVLLRARALDGVRLEVHDDGPGVAVKYRELIWDRIERGAHRFDAATPGSGIGLAIVHGLVQARGGTASYEESRLLGGACFVVNLPLSPVQIPRAYDKVGADMTVG